MNNKMIEKHHSNPTKFEDKLKKVNRNVYEECQKSDNELLAWQQKNFVIKN